MKQISCESGFSASASPCRRATSRTSGLVMPPQRKQRVRKLLLRQPEEEVSLVLGTGPPAASGSTARAPHRTRLPRNGRSRCRSAPIDRAVLSSWSNFRWLLQSEQGIGVRPGEVLAHERPHHIGLEALLLVDHVIRNAQVLGHAPRVVNIVQASSTARPSAPPESHACPPAASGPRAAG